MRFKPRPGYKDEILTARLEISVVFRFGSVAILRASKGGGEDEGRKRKYRIEYTVRDEKYVPPLLEVFNLAV